MTTSKDKGKAAPKGVKKLAVKKETVKDLGSGRGKAKELGDDELGTVNGGNQKIPFTSPAACLGKQVVRTDGPSPCLRTRPGCAVTTPGGGC